MGSDITEITKERNLTAHEALLLHVLKAGMNQKNKRTWRAQKTLGAEMGRGVHRVTVYKCIKRLNNMGLIEIERDELGKAKAYRINYPWPDLAQDYKPALNDVAQNYKGVAQDTTPCYLKLHPMLHRTTGVLHRTA